jgi:hypothetical protein
MIGGYVYEDGSFKCDGEMGCSDGGSFGYQFIRKVQGSLSESG